MNFEALDQACLKIVESLRGRLGGLDGSGPSMASALLWRDSKTGERLLGEGDRIGAAPRSGRLCVVVQESSRLEKLEREALRRGYRVIGMGEGLGLEIETPSSMREGARVKARAMGEPTLARLRLCAQALLKNEREGARLDPKVRQAARERLNFWESQAKAMVEAVAGAPRKKRGMPGGR
jgi:hypothetical protein